MGFDACSSGQAGSIHGSAQHLMRSYRPFLGLGRNLIIGDKKVKTAQHILLPALVLPSNDAAVFWHALLGNTPGR